MVEERKKPEIRFDGFSNDWEARKLGEIVEIIDGDRGINYPNGDDFQEHGHTLFLSAANITKNGFSFDSNQYITEAKSESLGNGKLQLNDVVLTSRGSLGHAAWYSEKIWQQEQYLRINSGMLLLRSRENTIPCFVEQFLNSPMGRKHIELISFGSAQPQLTKKDVTNYAISFTDTAEQAAIGIFFRSLDGAIILKKQQHEKTVNIKKAMLEKMFPKNGADVPEIRFDGFSGEWETRKLGELAEHLEYGLNTAAKKYDGENKYLRITDIDDESRTFIKSGLTSPDIDLFSVGDYLLREGDVVFARTGESVGKTYRYRLEDGKVYFAGFLIRARIKAEYDSEFLFQSTLTSTYNKFIQLTSQRSGQPGINVREYSDFVIALPDKNEQTAIGNFFRNLDILIQAQWEEIEKLQNIKKACLNKMFV